MRMFFSKDLRQPLFENEGTSPRQNSLIIGTLYEHRPDHL